MVTSDQIVGRPRTECAVTSILTESATTPVNWYTSVIVQIKQSQKVCLWALENRTLDAVNVECQNPVSNPPRQFPWENQIRGRRLK